MRLNWSKHHKLVCLGMAITVSAAVFGAEYISRRLSTQEHALVWSRQIAAQVEAVALQARERGERSPLDWAIQQLAQGTEPRAYRLSKYAGPSAPSENEKLSWDFRNKAYEYSRTFDRDSGYGVKIQIDTSRLGAAGFLGTTHPLITDAAALVLTLLLWAGMLWASNWAYGVGCERTVRKQVLAWAGRAKTSLTDLGRHVRDLIKQAHDLVLAASNSRGAIQTLRERIRGEIDYIRESRSKTQDVDKTVAMAESVALNAAIEANHLGSDGKSLVAKLQQLHHLIHQLSSANMQYRDALERIAVHLEPWAQDADKAFQTYEEVFRVTGDLNAFTRKTSESLLEQAKNLQDLKGKAA